jgi:hypothetical protein
MPSTRFWFRTGSSTFFCSEIGIASMRLGLGFSCTSLSTWLSTHATLFFMGENVANVLAVTSTIAGLPPTTSRGPGRFHRLAARRLNKHHSP